MRFVPFTYSIPLQVTLEGVPKNPEELDNYYKNKGPIPKFGNDFGCITDVVAYRVNDSALGEFSSNVTDFNMYK